MSSLPSALAEAPGLERSAYRELHVRQLAFHETLAAALAPRRVLMVGRSERIADPARLRLTRLAPHTHRRAA